MGKSLSVRTCSSPVTNSYYESLVPNCFERKTHIMYADWPVALAYCAAEAELWSEGIHRHVRPVCAGAHNGTRLGKALSFPVTIVVAFGSGDINRK